MSFYEDMADVARELLAPTDKGGLGQGTIELVRFLPPAPPANAWDPPAPQEREITVLDGVARGVSRDLIGAPVETGGQIIATDLIVTVAPWPGSYELGDVLEIDDSPVTVLKAENIPAAGVVCAVHFVVRR